MHEMDFMCNNWMGTTLNDIEHFEKFNNCFANRFQTLSSKLCQCNAFYEIRYEIISEIALFQ